MGLSIDIKSTLLTFTWTLEGAKIEQTKYLFDFGHSFVKMTEFSALS